MDRCRYRLVFLDYVDTEENAMSWRSSVGKSFHVRIGEEETDVSLWRNGRVKYACNFQMESRMVRISTLQSQLGMSIADFRS